MRNGKLVLGLMVLVSWLTLPFLGWKNIKRYLPASMIISVFIFLEDMVAKKRNRWVIFKKLTPNFNGIAPFILGPVLAGSLLILRISYGKPLLYFSLNLLTDWFFVYPFYRIFKNLGYFSLVRMKQWQFLSTFFLKSVLMYQLQSFFNKKYYKKKYLFF